MIRDVYEKTSSRHYKRIGMEFRGFPSEGLWFVEEGKENLIMKVGELPDPYPLARLYRYKDIVVRFIMNLRNDNRCANDLADELFSDIAKEEEKDRVKAKYMLKGVIDKLWERRTEDSDIYDLVDRLTKVERMIFMCSLP